MESEGRWREWYVVDRGKGVWFVECVVFVFCIFVFCILYGGKGVGEGADRMHHMRK